MDVYGTVSDCLWPPGTSIEVYGALVAKAMKTCPAGCKHVAVLQPSDHITYASVEGTGAKIKRTFVLNFLFQAESDSIGCFKGEEKRVF